MKALTIALSNHPRITSVLGAISGWFSYETLVQAKEWAQFCAACLAGLVSLCALILTGPKAVEQLRKWARAIFG